MTIRLELQKAIDALDIQDVYLRSGQFQCFDDFDPKYAPELAELNVQQMHSIRHSAVVDVEGDGRLLRVFIALGTRWVGPIVAGEEAKVYAVIEAEYVAEYRIKVELEQLCMDEFALNNASFHVWPYWREYVSSQCERMRLPRLVLPTVQLAHHRVNDEESKA